MVVGNAVGSDNASLAKQYFKLTCGIALVTFLLLPIAVMYARKPIIGLFTEEKSEVFALTVKVVPIVGIKVIWDGMQGYAQGVIKALGL